MPESNNSIHTFSPLKTIGVVGAGAMGRGIAQLFAQAGAQVWIYDTQVKALDSAVASIGATFQSLIEKGRMSAQAGQEARSRIAPAASLDALKPCDLVIEAVIERLDIKQELFKALEGIVAPNCILASNTSSLSVAAIASVCEHAQRVAGYHFFNPVPLMKVVEVIRGPRTEPRVIEQLCALAKR